MACGSPIGIPDSGTTSDNKKSNIGSSNSSRKCPFDRKTKEKTPVWKKRVRQWWKGFMKKLGEDKVHFTEAKDAYTALKKETTIGGIKTATELLKSKLLSYAPQIKDKQGFGDLYSYVMQLSPCKTPEEDNTKRETKQGTPPKKLSPSRVKQERDTHDSSYLSKIKLILVDEDNNVVDSSSSSSMARSSSTTMTSGNTLSSSSVTAQVSTMSLSTTSMLGNTLSK